MTRLMVLGLLSYKPMTGYEMQQQLQLSQTDKWAGILPGSIYHALKKLEQEGLIALDTVEQTGHRSKAIYSITNAGREELLKLALESLAQTSVVFPTTLYTAMSFVHLLPEEQVLAAIEKQRIHIDEAYRDMKAGQAAKENAIANLPAHVLLVFENMYEQFELQLRFLEQLRNIINEKGLN